MPGCYRATWALACPFCSSHLCMHAYMHACLRGCMVNDSKLSHFEPANIYTCTHRHVSRNYIRHRHAYSPSSCHTTHQHRYACSSINSAISWPSKTHKSTQMFTHRPRLRPRHIPDKPAQPVCCSPLHRCTLVPYHSLSWTQNQSPVRVHIPTYVNILAACVCIDTHTRQHRLGLHA